MRDGTASNIKTSELHGVFRETETARMLAIGSLVLSYGGKIEKTRPFIFRQGQCGPVSKPRQKYQTEPGNYKHCRMKTFWTQRTKKELNLN